MVPMSTLIVRNLEESANWREKQAEEFPNERRNAIAAEILLTLAAQARALEVSELHDKLDAIYTQDPERFNEAVSEAIKRVGFDLFPSKASDFLSGVMSKCVTH